MLTQVKSGVRTWPAVGLTRVQYWVYQDEDLYRRELERLHARYAHALDEDRLEDWPGFFAATASYRIVTAENLAAGLPLPLLYADSRITVLRILQDGDTIAFASGRYLDRILLAGENDSPQYEERVVVCDSRRFETQLAIPL